MTVLRVRVPLGPGESPQSFCSRLAYRVGRSSVRDFCWDLGWDFQSIVDGDPGALAKLASLGGCNPEMVAADAIRRTEGLTVFELRGQALRRASLRRNRIWVCPACLAEDMGRRPELGPIAAFGRTEWLIEHLRTCHMHDVPLIEAASATPQSPLHDFAEAVLPLVSSLPDWKTGNPGRKPSALENHLRDRLAGTVNESTPWINSLPFFAAARFAEFIGAVALHGPQVAITALTEDDWWEAGAAGYEIAAQGPVGFRRLLNQLTERFWSRKGDTGARKLLGKLYEWLAHDNDDAAYDPIREIMRQHVLDTIPIAPDEDLFGKPITERRLWSVQGASVATGAHPKRLRKLLAANGFPAQSDLPTDRVSPCRK